jgi:DNA-binding GntR family transcriptional regulator
VNNDELGFLGGLRGTTVTQSTYDRIKLDIVFGRLSPGKKLTLQSMKHEYSASVSILRETLNRLASDGFVTASPQRGFFVSPVSKQDLIEIGGLRTLLECYAIKESIQNGDQDWEGKLVAAHHKLKIEEAKMMSGDDSDKLLWKQRDWEFHLATISACNSRNLLSLHAIIFAKYLRYQCLVLTNRGEVAASEHRNLCEAALDRDSQRAETILTQHITGGLNHALDAMWPHSQLVAGA